MAKVLLVEDDNNLREIFEMRVQAEGYDTVVAGDGEEGLVVAMKEKPDLIVADVMMPKLSGFEMLETLRAAPEMANTKVIMMTALGQAEDQARGEKLGVVKYLVKSQVTLEDFARVIKEVLDQDAGSKTDSNASDSNKEESSPTNNQEGDTSMPPQDTNPLSTPAPSDPSADANPISSGAPADSSTPAVDSQQSSAQEQSSVDSQINDFVNTPSAPAVGDDTAAPSTDAAASGSTPVEHNDIPVADPPTGNDSATPPSPPSDTPADTPAPSTDPTPPPAGSSL